MDNPPAFPIHEKIDSFSASLNPMHPPVATIENATTEIKVVVHYSTVQCNTVNYTTVQYITIPSRIIIVIMSLKKNYTLTWDCSHKINQ